MFKWLALLLLALWTSPAAAQGNPTCPTRLLGDTSNACASTAFVNQQLTGSTTGVFTIGAPVVGNSSGNGLVSASRSGNSTQYATVFGALTNGHCVTINSGNFIDAGGACVTSGSGVSPGTAQQLAYYASTGSTVTGTFTPNFPATGFWYSDAGANIQRWNDRTQIAAGTVLDGKAAPTTLDWLATYTNGTGVDGVWPSNFSNLLVETLDSSAGAPNLTAITGAAQTLHATSPTGLGFEGINAWCLNNNTTLNAVCWGFYAESDRLNSTVGNTFSAEFDVRNLGNEVPINPISWGANMTVPLWIGCGSGLSSPTPNPCSAAIGILPNSAKYDAGIVFIHGAINFSGGHHGAIVLDGSDVDEIDWTNNAGTVVGSIDTNNAGAIEINTSGGLRMNTVFGATCGPGTVSGSFQAINGIVVHC